MKKVILLALFTAAYFSSFAQIPVEESEEIKAYRAYADSVHATLTYQTGSIRLSNGIAAIQVPKGFKYLDAKQSNIVLTQLWGNPESDNSLGMLFPEAMGPLDEKSWCFNIEYDAIGYVEDDDADDIDYDELLTDMKKEVYEANTERVKQGYESVELIGWASKPYYDEKNKILHWAKEIQFGVNENHTLNYNVRVLGRKGVLILNAIASMNDIKTVQQNIGQVTHIVKFTEGNKYENFNPDIDQVAAYSIGGLVAGKVLAKAGFFALLLKFWKVLAVGVAGLGTYLWRLISGGKNEYTKQ